MAIRRLIVLVAVAGCSVLTAVAAQAREGDPEPAVLKPGHPLYAKPQISISPLQQYVIRENPSSDYWVEVFLPRAAGSSMGVSEDELVGPEAGTLRTVFANNAPGSAGAPQGVAQTVWAKEISICANGPFESTPGYGALPEVIRATLRTEPVPNGMKPIRVVAQTLPDGAANPENQGAPECGYMQSFFYVVTLAGKPLPLEEGRRMPLAVDVVRQCHGDPLACAETLSAFLTKKHQEDCKHP